jgi:hypothetical protein
MAGDVKEGGQEDEESYVGSDEELNFMLQS